jgi:hypothetical protein
MPTAWLRGRRRSGAGGDGWTCIVVEKYTSRVYTVCRGMTVCARCYLMFVYLNRYFLILFEHYTQILTARSLVHSRGANSEKNRGRVCARLTSKNSLSDFYVRWSPLRSLSCDLEMALKGGLQYQVCLVMVGQARVPYSLYRTES